VNFETRYRQAPAGEDGQHYNHNHNSLDLTPGHSYVDLDPLSSGSSALPIHLQIDMDVHPGVLAGADRYYCLMWGFLEICGL
jgi:hypothetical protein